MEDLKKTTDVWFAAFLMKQGHKVASYDVIQRGKVRCHFALSEQEWQKMKLEFNNSEIIKFKALIDQLKDLSF